MCVSIYEGANDKTHYFFVKEDQEKILACKRYREIADRDVRRYCIIGGGIYPVELCIGLE